MKRQKAATERQRRQGDRGLEEKTTSAHSSERETGEKKGFVGKKQRGEEEVRQTSTKLNLSA